VPTLADFARDRYLPHVRERLCSAANPEAQLRLRIVPFLGRKALDEITQNDVAALRRRLLAEGLAGATVNRHLATLRSMFNLALRWQLYEGRNPAASPGMLPERHRDRFLAPEETRALVRALDLEPCREAASALALLILTGARKQEVLRRGGSSSTWAAACSRCPCRRAASCGTSRCRRRRSGCWRGRRGGGCRGTRTSFRAACWRGGRWRA